jgi:hypothetical protein
LRGLVTGHFDDISCISGTMKGQAMPSPVAPATFDNGLAATEVIDAMLVPVAQGGAPVTL